MNRTIFIVLFALLIAWGPIAYSQPIVRTLEAQSYRSTGDWDSLRLARDSGHTTPPHLDSADQGLGRSRFGIRLSAGLGGLTTKTLADALAKYNPGEFQQASVRAYGGIGLLVDLPASLQLSLVVDYSTAEFLFYPDPASSHSSMASWDVSVVPISVFLCYSPPFMMGPVRISVGFGGSYVLSTIEQTSNYAVGSTVQQTEVSPTFGGYKKTLNSWGVDFTAACTIELSQHVRAGLRGNYMVTTTDHHLRIEDQRPGTMTVDMDIGSMSVTIGVEFLFRTQPQMNIDGNR